MKISEILRQLTKTALNLLSHPAALITSKLLHNREFKWVRYGAPFNADASCLMEISACSPPPFHI